MSEPHQPPKPPEFTPGQATPPPYEPEPEYPPTSQFPPVNYAPPGYTPDYGQQPPGQGQYPPPPWPGYGAPPPPPPPRRSNKPIIAVIVAVSLLLCGGVVTAGVLLVQRATQEVQEATADVLPTEAPALPTDLPELPTDLPNLPGLDEGAEITVTYEVTGDGPANIIYAEQLGSTPKVVENVDLPWKVTTKMKGAAFVSVTATRGADGDGSIECRATVDDEEVATNSAAGGWATTTCNKLIFK